MNKTVSSPSELFETRNPFDDDRFFSDTLDKLKREYDNEYGIAEATWDLATAFGLKLEFSIEDLANYIRHFVGG